MCRVSEKIQNKEKAEDVKNLMEGTGWTFAKACDILKIPAERRPAIKELMQQLIADDTAPDSQTGEEKI